MFENNGQKAGLDRRNGCLTDMGHTKYCVLFVQTLRQWEAGEAIRRMLPDGMGTVFYPCAELWMGSLGQTVIQPLFPGYVFIRSSLPRSEIHACVRESRREVLSFIKELRVSRDRLLGEDDFGEDITDLSDGEAELLDFMLGFRYEDGSFGNGNGSDFMETEQTVTEKGKRIYRRKLPKAGVLGISRGYRDSDGKYVVMEGPLAGHGDRIVDANARDRAAWLDLKVGGRPAKVGLELKSKRYWHPQDRNAPVVLEDGFEIDPMELAAAIMRPKG